MTLQQIRDRIKQLEPEKDRLLDAYFAARRANAPQAESLLVQWRGVAREVHELEVAIYDLLQSELNDGSTKQ